MTFELLNINALFVMRLPFKGVMWMRKINETTARAITGCELKIPLTRKVK